MSQLINIVANPLTRPSYTSVWGLERNFNLSAWRTWFGSYWSLSIYISVVYLCVIFLGQKLMRNRKPFDLRKLLCSWNFALAAFSIIGTLRSAPELIHTLKQDNGFHVSVCLRYYSM